MRATVIPVPMLRRLRQARVARLATIGEDGAPRIVPVCFAVDRGVFYTPIDRKPKRGEPARVRNLERRKSAALLIDHYEENWRKLWYVMIRGQGKVLRPPDGGERVRALALLRAKYRQYRGPMLPQEAIILRISPRAWRSWQGESD